MQTYQNKPKPSRKATKHQKRQAPLQQNRQNENTKEKQGTGKETSTPQNAQATKAFHRHNRTGQQAQKKQRTADLQTKATGTNMRTHGKKTSRQYHAKALPKKMGSLADKETSKTTPDNKQQRTQG